MISSQQTNICHLKEQGHMILVLSCVSTAQYNGCKLGQWKNSVMFSQCKRGQLPSSGIPCNCMLSSIKPYALPQASHGRPPFFFSMPCRGPLYAQVIDLDILDKVGSAKGVEEVRTQLKQQVCFVSSRTPGTLPVCGNLSLEAISSVSLKHSRLCCILLA